jgi:uncharacterized protein (TIGR02145 family)
MKWIIIFALISSNAFAQFNCGNAFLDIRDSSNYRTVLIGNRCWMQQNLNYGKIVQSITTNMTHSDMHNDGIAEKYAPDGDSTNVLDYGALYEWDELMEYNNMPGGRGLCPLGWHVPTDAEWLSMFQSAGVSIANGTVGNSLKENGQGFGQGAGTNISGFSARAAGDRDSYGIFYGLGYRFIFWSSTETTIDQASHFTLWSDNDTIEHLATQKITGLSCRCILDTISTGINEINQNEINIYPNPASTEIIIESDNEQPTAISVCDALGKLIESIRTSKINVSNYANGIYFLKLSNQSGEVTRKLIVVH